MTHSAADRRLTVWIVEDVDLLRDSYARVVGRTEGFDCTGAFRSCEEALTRLETGPPPDVVLMDIELPGMSGVEGTREIGTRAPHCRVVMLTVHEDRDNVFEALCAGASGYLLKPASTGEITRSLQTLLDGDVPMSPRIARRVLTIFRRFGARGGGYGLSGRELGILELLVQGRTQPDIAHALHLSRHTVGNHIRSIYRKLQVHTRGGAVAKAVKERLV